MFSFFKKIIFGSLLVIFLFSSLAGTLMFPQPVKAMPVEITADLPRLSSDILSKVWESLKVAAVTASVQAVGYFTRKVAYDSAVWLASGGKGQTPFAHTKNVGDYLKSVADEAGGKALEELGKPFGLNLCQIPDARLDLALKIGLHNKFDPSNNVCPEEDKNADGKCKPDCTFTDAAGKWTSGDEWKSQYSGQKLEDRFNASISADQSDFGIFLSASEQIDRARSEQKASAAAQRQEDGGAKGMTDAIAGNIKTPGQVMKKQMEDNSPSEQQKLSNTQISAAFSTGMAQVIPSALSTFLNTLSGTVLNNFMSKGMLPFVGCVDSDKCPEDAAGGYGGYADNPYASPTSGRRAAEIMFQDFLTSAQSISTVDNYDLLSQLSACPDMPGPDNCAADSGLVQAVQQVSYGKKNPLTIKEAMNRGLLHRDWQLISPTRVADQNRDCYNKAYCHANVKVLRKARILPLGFEIAASLSNPDMPWTLGQVVDGFDKCKIENGQVINDPVNYPFCHLIDPNWVLKLPATKCSSLAYGQFNLADGLADRAQECVDMQNCVAYDAKGNCTNYGYCTKEKNVWKFDADTCDSYYDTCQAFNINGNQTAYLTRTLQTSDCTADNVGCLAYSLNQDNNGWLDPAFDLNRGVNNGIHLNKKNVTVCSSDSAGCTRFTPATPISGVNSFILKKAPDFFKCYDSAPDTPTVEWPQTAAQLAKITPHTECKNYAGVCIPDEIGCNKYTPTSYRGIDIPGKFKPADYAQDVNGNTYISQWNDQCDAVCVGYAAFRELETNYAKGQELAYIIPTNSAVCSLQESSCASFTNLEVSNAQQMAQVEYYSYLRPCIKPDPTRQKNYYTYEGTDQGYQLITFTLVANEADNANGPKGAPKYFNTDLASLAANGAACNAINYTAGLTGSDCRQFNDDAGNVYYRLLSKTIAVADSCTDYRLNKTELKNGQCMSGGELRDGYCIYSGLPSGTTNNAGVSRSCSADKETCRPYKGNAGNNMRTIFSDNFEGDALQALTGWSANGGAIAQSAESTHLKEHSLAFSSVGSFYKSVQLTEDKSYTLEFWAKGENQNLTVAINNSTNVIIKAFGSVTVGSGWKNYSLGPIELPAGNVDIRLTFMNEGNKRVFIDNVSLIETTDLVYLVKKNLKVDPVCDGNQNDNLPGQALGCQAYKDANNVSYSLTGFSSLCREEAIGCLAFVDTFNTASTAISTYNVWISGAAGAKVALGNLKDASGLEFSCQIPSDATGCYIKSVPGYTMDQIKAANPNATFTASTVVVPADNSVASPVYLVANKDGSCTTESDVGCTLAGLQTITPNGPVYTTTTIKNDPSTYDTTLCGQEAVGCSSFVSGQSTFYFKDPAVVGQKVCAYKEEVYINGTKTKGWYWKGVGKCANGGGFCQTSADCASGDTCADIGNQPCYSDYFTDGTTYNLWSSGNKDKYNNFVGECTVEQSGCTAFVDHNSKDQLGKDNKYYLLNNSRFAESQDTCGGQVSEREGCILLDNVNSPNKLWNTEASYQESLNKQYALVVPTNDAKNDANVVVKVVRDRECSEWLYCNHEKEEINKKTGQTEYRCYGLGLCNKAQSGSSESTQCASTLPKGNVSWLSENTYRRRDVSWSGQDYSGLSLFEQYPVVDYRSINIADDKSEQYYLAKTQEINQCVKNDGKHYGADNNADGAADGWCVQNNAEIAYPIGGVSSKWADNFINENNNQEKLVCRGYPEKDSPFDKMVYTANTSKFENANICAGTDCDCNYKKVFYGQNKEKTLYFGEGDQNIPESICSAGTYANLKCDSELLGVTKEMCIEAGGQCQSGKCVNKTSTTNPNDNNSIISVNSSMYDDQACLNIDSTNAQATVNKAVCQNGGGSCLNQKGVANLTGWSGYCIERDPRRKIPGTNQDACLTWWPVDVAEGINDVFSFDETAMYGGIDSERYICLRNNPVQSTSWSGLKYNGNNAVCSNSQCIIKEGDQQFNDFGVLPAGNDEEAKNYWQDNQLISIDSFTIGNSGIYYVELNDVVKYQDYRPYVKGDFYLETAGQDNDWANFYTAFKYSDVMEGGVAREDDYFDKKEISQIDVYVDADRSGNNHIFPASVISFFPNNTGGEIGHVFNAVGKNTSFGFSQGNIAVGAVFDDDVGKVSYLQFFNDYTNTGIPVWKESKIFKALDRDQRPDRQNINKECGFGVRLIFQGNKIRGAWITEYDGGNCGEDQQRGFFFVFHFTNGECTRLGQISEVVNNKTNSKPFTWALRSANPINIGNVNRKEGTKYQFGLAKKAISLNHPVWANPFSYSWYALNLGNEDVYNRFFYEEYTGFEGGVSLENKPYSKDRQEDDNSYIDDLAFGFLGSMFAKVYKVFELSNGGYRESPISPLLIDAAGPKYSHYVPQIASPVLDSKICSSWDTTGCGISRLGAFSINGKDSENVYIQGSGTISLKFYAWADAAQMPLRRIKINFDDGYDDIKTESQSVGNKKPICLASSDNHHCDFDSNVPCNGDSDCQKIIGHASAKCVTNGQREGFGNTVGTGCTAGMYEYSVAYACDTSIVQAAVSRGEDWQSNPDLCYDKESNPTSVGVGHFAIVTDDPNVKCRVTTDPKYQIAKGTLVCAYKPRVQVLDNWGWCSGECSQKVTLSTDGRTVVSAEEPAKGSGCYEDAYPFINSPTLPYDQCTDLKLERKQNPWVNFAGSVIVIPNR